MANGFVTATDVSNNPNYPMVEGVDYIMNAPNIGGHSYVFSTGQGNGFTLVQEGATIWVDATNPIGFLQLLDGVTINGQNGYGIKLRPFNGPLMFDPLVGDTSYALHLQGDIHHFEVYGYEEYAGYLGARNGWKDYTGREMGIQFLNSGSAFNRVDIKMDGIGHTWVSFNGIYSKGIGEPYSCISFHKAGSTVNYENIRIVNCQLSNKRGEPLYGNSNSQLETQHGIIGLEVTNNLMEGSHYESIQIQHAQGNVIIKNNVFIRSAQGWENPFQPDQDGNGQLQHIRKGDLLVEDCIFLGGAQFVLLIAFFETWSGAQTGTVTFRNCIIGGSKNYGMQLGLGNLPIVFEDCTFVDIGGSNFTYDQVYSTQTAKDYVAFLNNPYSVTFRRCTYPVGINLYSGTASNGVTLDSNTQANANLPQFKACPVQIKKPGYKYQEVADWMFEIMIDTDQGSNVGKRTGEPVIFEVGVLRTYKGRWYECLIRHKASDSPEIAAGYDDIAALLADQAGQVNGEWYRVEDASTDPMISSGKCYYQYNGVANGLLSDYTSIYAGEYADVPTLLSNQGSQVNGSRYRVVNTGADPNFTNSVTRSYIYNGVATGSVDDYTVVNEGVATGTYDLVRRPDQDVGPTPAPDGNAETIGTYWKLLWFWDSMNSQYTTEAPSNYVLVDGSEYGSMGLINPQNSIVKSISKSAKRVIGLL